MGGATGMRAPSASMTPRRDRPGMGGGWSTSGHDGRAMMSGGGIYNTDMGMQNWLQRSGPGQVINDLRNAVYQGPSMPTDPNNLGALRDWTRNYVDQMRAQRDLSPSGWGSGTIAQGGPGYAEIGGQRAYAPMGGGGWQSGTGGPVNMPGYMDQELAPLGGPAPMARNIALQQMNPWARYR